MVKNHLSTGVEPPQTMSTRAMVTSHGLLYHIGGWSSLPMRRGFPRWDGWPWWPYLSALGGLHTHSIPTIYPPYHISYPIIVRWIGHDSTMWFGPGTYGGHMGPAIAGLLSLGLLVWHALRRSRHSCGSVPVDGHIAPRRSNQNYGEIRSSKTTVTPLFPWF